MYGYGWLARAAAVLWLAAGQAWAGEKSPTAAEIKKITDAMPAQATSKPAKPRKILVFTLCKGFPHSSVPVAAKALEIMGQKTGAFEATVSNDPALFAPDKLKDFDAVVMDNTTGDCLGKDEYKKALVDFVKSGKGLVGIHAATDCMYNVKEYGEMIGGYFSGHPWNEKVFVKIDDPKSPINAAFKGEGFEVKDEIYQFKEPYSRKVLHELLSLDTTKTNMKKQLGRKDNDFAVSWIREYGQGRVFYCSLGHDHDIFWNPKILQHYLDGIQYALGDLKADATPSEK